MTLKITRCLFLVEKQGISILPCLLPETSSCVRKPLLLRCNLVIPQCIYQVSLGLKEVQIEAHDFENNKVPLFGRKTGKNQYFDVCCPVTSSCASKPL